VSMALLQAQAALAAGMDRLEASKQRLRARASMPPPAEDSEPPPARESVDDVEPAEMRVSGR